jgi:hypothetical protein
LLTWKRVDGRWLGNGFQIRRDDSGHWIIVELGDEDDLIEADPAPMALPTLSAAKYAAEQEHKQRDTAFLRRRLTAVALGAASLAALVSSNPLVFIGLGVVAAAAGLELAMTWFAGRLGGARDITQ